MHASKVQFYFCKNILWKNVLALALVIFKATIVVQSIFQSSVCLYSMKNSLGIGIVVIFEATIVVQSIIQSTVCLYSMKKCPGIGTLVIFKTTIAL